MTPTETQPNCLPGAVLMDNSTLHAVSCLLHVNKRFARHYDVDTKCRPDCCGPFIHSEVPFYSLAELVESLIIHERIYVDAETLGQDRKAQQIVEECDDIIMPYQPSSHQQNTLKLAIAGWDYEKISQILMACECEESRHRHQKWHNYHYSYLGFEHDDISRRYETFHSLFYQCHRGVGSNLEDKAGPYPIDDYLQSSWHKPEEIAYFAFLAKRLIYYFELARIAKIPYVPNVVRSRLLLTVLEKRGGEWRSFARFILDEIEQIRAKRDRRLNEVAGHTLFAVDTPLILAYILTRKKPSTVIDIVHAALEIRDWRKVRQFRQWATQVTNAILLGQRDHIDEGVKALERLSDELSHDEPLFGLSKFAVGIPFSIQFTLPGVWSHPILFLRDVYSRSQECDNWYRQMVNIVKQDLADTRSDKPEETL